MRKTLIAVVVCIGATMTVFGQDAAKTSDFTRGSVTYTGNLGWGDASTLGHNPKIESVNLTADGLEVVKSELRYPRNLTYTFTCGIGTACKASLPERHAWKEIYGVDASGKLALLRTINATVVPAKDEEIIWPKEKQ